MIPQVLMTLLEGLVRNPWRTTSILLCKYVVLCQMFHNGCGTVSGPCGSGIGDTLSIHYDTILHYDTIPVVFEFQKTTPKETVVQRKAIYRPPVVVMGGATCSDSVSSLLRTVSMANKVIENCDSTLREQTALRTFSDEMEWEGYKVRYDSLQVKGIMTSPPQFTIVDLTPDTLITKTVTVMAPVNRKFGLGVEAGPRLQTPKTYDAINFSINVGYMDRKNNVFLIEAGYDTRQTWEIKAGYRKWFDIP
jgi:hypothetical protein